MDFLKHPVSYDQKWGSELIDEVLYVKDTEPMYSIVRVLLMDRMSALDAELPQGRCAVYERVFRPSDIKGYFKFYLKRIE